MYMARIILHDGVTLKGARRIITMRGGDFRITRRFGSLYTFKKFKCKQPNSEKQMECRDLLRRSNEMAREDMAREGRRDYWERMAKERGYKTAVGCARAWFISVLKREMEEKSDKKTNGTESEKRVMIEGKRSEKTVSVERKMNEERKDDMKDVDRLEMREERKKWRRVRKGAGEFDIWKVKKKRETCEADVAGSSGRKAREHRVEN